MKKAIKKITWSFEEGRFWDLWAFTHILAGVVLGLFFELLELGFFVGFVVSAGIMIVWEIGEIFFKIEETGENRVLDVLYGVIAYSLTYSIAVPMSPWLVGLALGFFAVLKGAIEYKGWKAYRSRTSKSSKG